MDSSRTDLAAPPWPASRTRLLLLVLLAAAFLLHLPRLLMPVLIWDDFEILTDSWPWEVTRANLWYSANEHVMPLGRLTTWMMVEATPRLSWLPWVAGLQGPLAVLAGMLLLHLFVSRERGHPVYGLAAAAVFGVTTNYVEAVSWFSASFSVLAIDTLLLGLLAAQGWRRTGRKAYLALAVLAVALAPCWFAIGILAGPVCLLYLVFGGRRTSPPNPLPETGRGRQSEEGLAPPLRFGEGVGGRGPTIDWSPWCWTPLLGTALFLAVSLPLTAQRIMHLEHYQDKTAVESFGLGTGLLYLARSLTDNVVLGSLGLPAIPLPQTLTLALAPLWLGLLLWWWWRAPHRGLVVTGAGCLFAGYLLIYGARSAWEYQLVAAWSRYNLSGQLGLALIVAGGLPVWKPDWERGWRGLLVVIAVLTLLQLPRGWPHVPAPAAWKERLRTQSVFKAAPALLREAFDNGENLRARQLHDLARVDAVGGQCRAQRISSAQAQDALEPFFITNSSLKANGWKLLRGSDDPDDHSPERVRRLLAAEGDGAKTIP